MPEKKPPLLSLQPVIVPETRGRKKKTELEPEEEARFTEICGLISEGRTLKAVLRRRGMPAMKTFYRWINEYDEDGRRATIYAAAMLTKADTLVDEALDIADNGNKNDVRRATLRVNTRLDVAAKMNPAKWSLKLTHSGDKDNPIQHQHAARESQVAVLDLMRQKRKLRGTGTDS